MSAPPNLRIERLVLDIPGFDPDQAASLAREIAAHLAAANLAGTHARITLAVSPAEAAAPHLARRLAGALLRRLA